MTKHNINLFILSIIITLLSVTPALAKRCIGANPCEACTTCNYCKHCSQDNGHCGICMADATQKPPTRANKHVQGSIINKH